MLETIKQTIAELVDEPFDVFFTKYVIAVQDINIQKEIQSLQNCNSIDLDMMSKVIEETYRRLLQ